MVEGELNVTHMLHNIFKKVSKKRNRSGRWWHRACAEKGIVREGNHNGENVS